ncbi:MAG: hypothetical protein N2595_08580 [bacterium]|nr:hypothetical protein [bacterium]
MLSCPNADFEHPAVPPECGADPWTPSHDGSWQFHGTAALINTAAPAWRGPRADDGAQIAVLPTPHAAVSQLLQGFIPGATYHLRWSEAAPTSGLSSLLIVSLVSPRQSQPDIIAHQSLPSRNGWLRRELVFIAREPSYVLTFTPHPQAVRVPVFLDRIRLWQEPSPPPPGFPQFLVPGHDAYMDALRNWFFLHYTSGRILATFSMHWMAESVLWPALESYNNFSQRVWSREQICSRRISPEGYVSCHQHIGLGHPEGWPFPLWSQGPGVGWHFAAHGIPWLAPANASDTTTTHTGLSTLSWSGSDGWRFRIETSAATIEFPAFLSPAVVASYFIINWVATVVPTGAQCYLEWRSLAHPTFSPRRRVSVELTNLLPKDHQQWLSLRDHPEWLPHDTLTGVRLVFENAIGTHIQFFYLCTAVDTRHNNNGALYIDACHSYATWCGDVAFLQSEVPRMRRAVEFMLTEFQVATHGCVYTPWLGHDGSSGIFYDEHGVKHIRHGHGIGNNYWDLLPFGGRDPYATLYLYNALLKLAELEEAVAAHPEWEIVPPPPALSPHNLRHLAQRLKSANTQFWNSATGRFAPVDLSGVMHDYGFTFLNCEAAYYGYATPEQVEAIMQWLEGSRIVSGDTSTGADIYHWRFGPRATTRRNIDYYTYPWHAPEDIPFGGQVQDGGAVLGFSYHDLMLRLHARGPDNAWQRLREILDWFKEVLAEGGYREYYYGSTVETRGTLQGGGTAGGLGLDCEFFESILVPQVMLYGFMGIRPHMDGLRIAPRLPSAWSSLTITQVRFHTSTLTISATADEIRVTITEGPAEFLIFLPNGMWRVTYASADGATITTLDVLISLENPGVPARHLQSSLLRARRLTAQTHS